MIRQTKPTSSPKKSDDLSHRVILCEKCNNRFMLPPDALHTTLATIRPVEGLEGVLEFGLVCPGCNTFYHSGYTTKLLESQRREAELTHHPTRRSYLRGKFTRRFARFQAEMAARLASKDST